MYNENLYAGTVNNTTGAEVWEYDGTIWTQVNTDGFGDVKSHSVCMAVYKGSLFVGTDHGTAGTEVWKTTIERNELMAIIVGLVIVAGLIMIVLFMLKRKKEQTTLKLLEEVS